MPKRKNRIKPPSFMILLKSRETVYLLSQALLITHSPRFIFANLHAARRETRETYRRRGNKQTAIGLHALHRRACVRARHAKKRAPRTRTRRAHAYLHTRPSLYLRLRRSVRFSRKRTLVTLLSPLKNFAA